MKIKIKTDYQINEKIGFLVNGGDMADPEVVRRCLQNILEILYQISEEAEKE